MKNNRTLLILLITIIALFIGAIVFIPQLKDNDNSTNGANINLDGYDVSTFIDASDDNGGIADHVKGGDISTAKVLMFEYADYQCPACANVNLWIKDLLAEYEGQVAVIYRSTPLTSIHPNAIAAASAVEAAGLQGYWEEYGDLVFQNQAEWNYATGSKRTEYFANYFDAVSNGTGDVNKFKADMAGDAVKAKVNFDRAISESLDITATPSFYDSKGQEINWTSGEQTETGIKNYFRNYFNKLLGVEGSLEED